MGDPATGAATPPAPVTDAVSAEEALLGDPVEALLGDAAGTLLGLPCEGAVAAVSRALRAGEPVRLVVEVPWPLPALPVAADGTHTVRVTDRAVRPAGHEVLLRPPSLVVGVGASGGVPVEEVSGLVERTLREAGLSAASVAALATVDTKAAEPGVVGAAERLGVPLVTYPAGRLASVAVPHPSPAPLATTGTPSVAEAAALLEGGELLVPKRKSAGRPARATCAVVRRPEPAAPAARADRLPHASGEPGP